MTKPVYFPFTYIDAVTARRTAALWGGIRVYLPSAMVLPETMGDLAGTGIIEPFQPVTEESQVVETIHKAYRQWKESTSGAELAFLKTPESGGIPFFDETAVNHLRDTIVRQSAGAEDASAHLSDKVLGDGLSTNMAARVFLRITADYDAQTTAVSRSIETLADREQAMFRALKGEDDDLFEKHPKALGAPGMADDPGRLMTGARIRAWARLAAHDPDAPGIWVTTSSAVFDYVIDRMDPEETGMRVFGPCQVPDAGQTGVADAAMNEWCRSFAVSMGGLCNAGDPGAVAKTIPLPPACSHTVPSMTVSVYVLPALTVAQCLTDGTGALPGAGGMPALKQENHIVIIWLS
ncbi:MAG: hypothetical protein SWH61_17035 [Thermodesulfobacteriota bacterium]|nr:hypothetical protein [Thermodesulfobacteriota bacterium]